MAKVWQDFKLENRDKRATRGEKELQAREEQTERSNHAVVYLFND